MRSAIVAVLAALAIAAPAAAESDPNARAKLEAARAARNQFYSTSEKSDFRASILVGSRVYATQAEIKSDTPTDEVSADWVDIGEINDLVIGKDGYVRAVVIGVGGFLGIGEKNVAVRMAALRFVKKSSDDADEYFIVFRSDKASLDKVPAYTFEK